MARIGVDSDERVVTRTDDMVEIRLRDDSIVLVRPIRPEDRVQIARGLTEMSARSRYLRFHTQVEKLTDTQLDYLVDVNHVDHDALVALDASSDAERGVGIARYIRTADEPSVAEAAIAVIDEFQGRGLGTALVGLLERLAYERGIRTLRNYVLAENQGMLAIFRELEGEMHSEGSGLYRVDVPIPAPDAEQPDTPAGRWITSVGRARERDDAHWAYPAVWLARRLGGIGDMVEELKPANLIRRMLRQDDEPGTNH